jgi:uncharacterized protein YbjQ (UPF0145 family)
MGLFGFWKTGTNDGQRSLERQAVWEQALAQNRLPGFVADRLKSAAAGTTPWMATMSAAELLVSRSHGIRPVATVTGTCALHYGYSWTRGHAEGWRTAVARLMEEAALCQANAVVDVKMRTARIGVVSSMDYTLVGTAVKIDGLPAGDAPVICTVSALEFARLLEAGIVPVGIAVGAAYQWLQNNMYDIEGSWSANNRPLPALGQFWEGIRREAQHDLANDARQQGNGVLAHTNFGELLKREGGDNTPPAYLGRHIVMGTVIDTQSRHPVPHAITTVVDMRDEASPFTGEGPTRHQSPLEQEGGEI